MHAPELGNRLVVWRQPSQQPHQLDVPSALRFQPPRGPDLLKIAVQIEFQQIARIIARPPSLCRLGALKSQTRHVQPIDKCIDDTAHVIVRNQLFQSDRKEGRLGPAFTLHIAHKKDTLAFTKASSHLFSDGQQSFVTICFWSRVLSVQLNPSRKDTLYE